MIHSINTSDGKSAIQAPTEILDAKVLDGDVLDGDILDADLVETDPLQYSEQYSKQCAQKHSSIGHAKRHLTVTQPIMVIPEGAPSASQTTAGAVQSVVISSNTASSSQLTNYVINSDLSTYLQPYPSVLFSAPSLSNGPRRIPSIRLPWLELGSGLAAFTIVSGVVVIDGLKQAQLSPSKPTAQLTPPKLTSIAKSNPLGTSQMSVAELMNSGRSLPMPNSAMNVPTRQIASNPVASNSGNFGSLNMPSGNMKTVDLTQIGTTAIASNSTLPKLKTPPLMPRRPIAMPETQVSGSQVLPAPRMPVRTQQQPIPQPVSQQPPLNPSAFPPQEIPETPIVAPVAPVAPALPTTSSNPADPLTYNRPDLIQVPTPPKNPSVSTSNVGRSSVLAPVRLEPGMSPLTLKPTTTGLMPQTKEEMANSQIILNPDTLTNQPAMLRPTIQDTIPPTMPPSSEESLRLKVSKP